MLQNFSSESYVSCSLIQSSQSSALIGAEKRLSGAEESCELYQFYYKINIFFDKKKISFEEEPYKKF